MAVRIKDLREMTFFFQDGFSGTSAINDATIVATDTVIGVDTHALFDERTLVPIGARFTTAGIATMTATTMRSIKRFIIVSTSILSLSEPPRAGR